MSAHVIKEIYGPVHLGEGPHWDPDEEALLYVDAFKGNFHRHYVNTGRHQVLHVEDAGSGGSVTVIIPIEGLAHHYIVTVGRSFAVVRWSSSDPDQHTVIPTILHTVDQEAPKNFFNDGKCDPEGRLWAGTRGPELPSGEIDMNKGTMYRLDSDLKVTPFFNKLSVSNGLTWNTEKTKFFYIDSQAYSIDVFDYNNKEGTVENRRKLCDYKASNLSVDIPDGMTIDVDGNLWAANYFGDKIICVDSHKGEIVKTVEMPVTSPTSLCWGGKDYSTLFVTSSQAGLSKEQMESKPRAGATYAINGLGTKGSPAQKLKVNMEILKDKMKQECQK